ncbi:MAG: NADH dehydrogenase subunit [Thermoprotei archaeon]|nr:MAG: NADH dehydrogenase subunit [Thermoprotei archaeon]RLE73470.1 MAG: NADH dehydrogenase subunit [Thermoprotei archaeon]
MSFYIPIGPQHPVHPEPLLMKFKVEGEQVIDVEINVSYTHRGIEKGFEYRDYMKGIFLAERICGICNAAHTLCYTQNIEQLLGKEIPPRAKYLRLIVEELSRIHSHLLWLGLAAHQIGFETLFMYVWRDREKVLDLLETITGNRVVTAYNTIGGVRRDITPEIEQKIRKSLDYLEERTKYFKKVVMEEPTVLVRTQNVGILKPREAIELFAVGPVLRASGIKHDIRADDPYIAHDEVPFNVVTYDTCDVYARILVRVDEILECINMVRYSLDHLPSGEYRIRMPVIVRPPPGESVSRVEAPRGELLHYVRSDGSDKPYRYKVRTPTLANIPSTARMLTSRGDYIVYIADIPIIFGSIDPCLCCTGRVMFIDIEKSKSWVWTYNELVRYSLKRFERHD